MNVRRTVQIWTFDWRTQTKILNDWGNRVNVGNLDRPWNERKMKISRWWHHHSVSFFSAQLFVIDATVRRYFFWTTRWKTGQMSIFKAMHFFLEKVENHKDQSKLDACGTSRYLRIWISKPRRSLAFRAPGRGGISGISAKLYTNIKMPFLRDSGGSPGNYLEISKCTFWWISEGSRKVIKTY